MSMIDWVKKRSVFSFIDVINSLQNVFVSSGDLYKILLIPHAEWARWYVGAWRAWYNAERTYRRVPAYKQFINQQLGGWPVIKTKQRLPNLSVLPETDKASYVKPYTTEDRCVDGIIPAVGVVVDESSGSSGTPTSWVRGPEERNVSKQLLQLSYHAILGQERFFMINAFALGAWATGLNVSMSLSDISMIKSTGPDLDKIITTIQQFGPNYRYVVLGYPPFLKTLADDPRIQWKDYWVEAVYGGEGMSESMRDYLLKTYKRVIGSYGASDLEINMAAENDFTIQLRRLIMQDKHVRQQLIRTDYGVTPMIFQYNPLAYYVETNDKGELVFTMCRTTNIAPKVRYNIHDRGHVLRYSALVKLLKQTGHWEEFRKLDKKLELPLLFHYGRSDMSIDYYGANVTPDSVREILFGIKDLAPVLNTFRLLSYENKQHDKLMHIAIELAEGKADKLDHKAIATTLLDRLADINHDFNNAYRHTATPDQYPKVTIHEFGTGPFEGGQRKLKNEYVVTDLKYDKL